MTGITFSGHTIDGIPADEWHRRQAAHEHPAWECDSCFSNHLFVPIWPNSSVVEPHEFDPDACETCWLASK